MSIGWRGRPPFNVEIVIYMYFDDPHPPHFHAMYEGLEGVFDFNENLQIGQMSSRAVMLIKEWATLQKKELEENWERAECNQPLNWIEPLR